MVDRYLSGRLRAGVMLAAVTAVALVGSAGCAKAKDKPVASGPTGSSAPSVAAPASPSAGAPDNGGAVVKAEDLQTYGTRMPTPKGAPAGGIWTEALPAQDGSEFVNYMDKDGKGYVSVHLIDCRMPAAQAEKSKAVADRGDFGVCFEKPTGSVKGYPLIVPADPEIYRRTLVVNHVSVIAGVWVGFDEKFKGADVEQFLGTLDLATLAKL